eukprot:TRINITY_DN38091_c0_g1_i1.p1 TRINITY_DN38091_c0_g1~~TRINITY_DN38091_c0_g1_i1.p1  ORF type:complete len:220 (-),score=39.71 TRINITY_DN38091_c0_g1_i1:2-661(-)
MMWSSSLYNAVPLFRPSKKALKTSQRSCDDELRQKKDFAPEAEDEVTEGSEVSTEAPSEARSEDSEVSSECTDNATELAEDQNDQQGTDNARELAEDQNDQQGPSDRYDFESHLSEEKDATWLREPNLVGRDTWLFPNQFEIEVQEAIEEKQERIRPFTSLAPDRCVLRQLATDACNGEVEEGLFGLVLIERRDVLSHARWANRLSFTSPRLKKCKLSL